jgi:hypothetical protein
MIAPRVTHAAAPHPTSRVRPQLAVVAALTLIALRLGAQQQERPTVQSAADAAIAQGRLDDAEQLLFAASSRATREPSARGALGTFLASRGRLKVGAVLLEEARQFGGDAAVIDARLARIYSWMGDWSAVAALKHNVSSGPEADRARWLASHAPGHSGPDSLSVPLEPNEAFGLGTVVVTIETAPIQVDIDPNVDGLVLPSWPVVTGGSQQFGMRDSATIAAVYALSIGTMRLANVPARLSPRARPVIGLDVLAALSPTFDAAAHRLTLRQHGAAASGETLPILLAFPGVRIVAHAGQPPVFIESAAGRAALRGSRWTLDVRHGAIVAER